jgi:hypothetical protein
VFRKISLAVVLMSVAGFASAGTGSNCKQVLWFTVCGPSGPAAQAPEIDPASAMTGLTMLAGGLTVLRGRRRKASK